MPLGTERWLEAALLKVLRIVQHAHHVFMPEQRPAQILTVRYRTALAHFVIGRNLISEHRLGSGIPIGLQLFVHNASLKITASEPLTDNVRSRDGRFADDASNRGWRRARPRMEGVSNGLKGNAEHWKKSRTKPATRRP